MSAVKAVEAHFKTVNFMLCKGFPLAQLVKNPPAMRDTWVSSLGWEDPLEKGKATHSSVLAWRIPWIAESDTTEQLSHVMSV